MSEVSEYALLTDSLHIRIRGVAVCAGSECQIPRRIRLRFTDPQLSLYGMVRTDAVLSASRGPYAELEHNRGHKVQLLWLFELAPCMRMVQLSNIQFHTIDPDTEHGASN